MPGILCGEIDNIYNVCQKRCEICEVGPTINANDLGG